MGMTGMGSFEDAINGRWMPIERGRYLTPLFEFPKTHSLWSWANIGHGAIVQVARNNATGELCWRFCPDNKIGKWIPLDTKDLREAFRAAATTVIITGGNHG